MIELDKAIRYPLRRFSVSSAANDRFGGIALAQAISAGQATIPNANFHMYSAQGSYLGPASTELPTVFKVEDLRTTRSFCTRLVTATQGSFGKPDTGRKVLVVLLDWHIEEEAVMLEYSSKPIFPLAQYGKAESLQNQNDYISETLSSRAVAQFQTTFRLFLEFFDARWCPNSMAAQNAYGWHLGRATSQDKLPITGRTNAVWVRIEEALQESEHIAATA